MVLEKPRSQDVRKQKQNTEDYSKHVNSFDAGGKNGKPLTSIDSSVWVRT